jgi:hypothetical protein
MGLLDLVTGSEQLREPAECTIRVDNREITAQYPYLSEVRVEMSRAAPATCSLSLDTMREENGRWLIQDERIFLPWKKLEVSAVFGSSREETVFTGYIREVRTEAPEDMSSAAVRVIGQDESILLDRNQSEGPLSSEQEPLTDGDIVSQMARDSDLSSDVMPGMTHSSLNNERTNIRFLRDRAEANGFEFFVREGVVHFKPPELEGDPQGGAIMVYAGRSTNCLRFSVRYDHHSPDQVRVIRAADTGTEVEEETYSSSFRLPGTSSMTSENMGLNSFTWRMQQPTGASLSEVQSRAQARANENGWKIIADGELDGSLYGHVLLTHKTVEVDGMGEADSGRYYVDEVTHVFDSNGYRQSFKLLRNGLSE